jgi:hypothetical protein
MRNNPYAENDLPFEAGYDITRAQLDQEMNDMGLATSKCPVTGGKHHWTTVESRDDNGHHIKSTECTECGAKGYWPVIIAICAIAVLTIVVIWLADGED